MSIIRTDNQADGVEILKLVIETADYYREMADVLEDKNVAAELATIANERASHIEPFRNLVRELGELPAQPDPDKELMQKIGGEITNLFSTDSKNAILDKCLQEDEKLAEALKNTKLNENSETFRERLVALQENLTATKQAIQALKD